MSKIYDITDKLTNDKPVIKIGEKEYTVNDSKNVVLKLNQDFKDMADVEAMDKAVEMILGKEAFKEIEAMQLNIASYKVLFTSIMAAVMGEEYETAEARFLTAEAKQS